MWHHHTLWVQVCPSLPEMELDSMLHHLPHRHRRVCALRQLRKHQDAHRIRSSRIRHFLRRFGLWQLDRLVYVRGRLLRVHAEGYLAQEGFRLHLSRALLPTRFHPDAGRDSGDSDREQYPILHGL